MVAGAREVARQAGRAGQARGADRQGDRRPGQRHRRPPRARRLRPRARVGRRGPRREEGAVHPARRHREARGASSPPTPRRCRSSRWPWPPSGPSRSCGIHFFNPAPMMSLVEVDRGRSPPATRRSRPPRRSPRPAARTSVEVKDRAGFIVNALLFPYLNNAVRMLESGHRQPRRHRHRHEGRLQLPDGAAGAARPRRPRHVAVDPRRALRRVPRPELRRHARSCAAWSPPASSAGSPARLLRLPEVAVGPSARRAP